MKPDVIFDKLTEGIEREVPEKIEKANLKKIDLEAAEKLMKAIVGVDKLFEFIWTREIDFRFVKKSNHRSKARSCYDHIAGEYKVYIEGLYHRLQQLLVPYFKENGHLLYDSEEKTLASLEERVITTAAHEIRHRLQKTTDLKMFSADRDSKPEGKPKEFVEYLNHQFGKYKAMLKRRGKSEFFASKNTSQTELDARVIELFVLYHIHQGIESLEVLKNLIRLDPESDCEP